MEIAQELGDIAFVYIIIHVPISEELQQSSILLNTDIISKLRLYIGCISLASWLTVCDHLCVTRLISRYIPYLQRLVNMKLVALFYPLRQRDHMGVT